jgi:hypothetical protein
MFADSVKLGPRSAPAGVFSVILTVLSDIVDIYCYCNSTVIPNGSHCVNGNVAVSIT